MLLLLLLMMLIEHYQDLNPGDDVVCPLCRSVALFPERGVDGFRHNFFIEELIQVSQTAAAAARGDQHSQFTQVSVHPLSD